MKRSAFAVAAALSALALPVSAQAATVVVTYIGIVSEGMDVTGVFGTAGQDLTGAAYTSVYTIDDGVPDVITNDDGISSSIYGGTNYGVATPITATLTINGITQSLGGIYIGIAAQADGLPTQNTYDITFHEAQDYTTDLIMETNNLVYNVIQSYTNNFITNHSYMAPMAYTVQVSDDASGAFQFFTGEVGNTTGSVNAFGALTPTSMTVAAIPSSPVPEPTTWAMMFAGFAFVGAISRSRKAPARVRYNFT